LALNANLRARDVCSLSSSLTAALAGLLAVLLAVLPDSYCGTLAAAATTPTDAILQAVAGPGLEDVCVQGRCRTARQGHAAATGGSRRICDGKADLRNPDGVVSGAHCRLASRRCSEDEMRDVVGTVKA